MPKEVWAFCKNAQLAQSAISGFGMCSQRACAEMRAGPDRNTACHILTIHPDTARKFAKNSSPHPACEVSRVQAALCRRSRTITNLHCLPNSKYGWQCPACRKPKDVCRQRQRKTGGLINEKYRDHSACLTLFCFLLFVFSRPFVFDRFYHFFGRAISGFCGFMFFCWRCNRKKGNRI